MPLSIPTNVPKQFDLWQSDRDWASLFAAVDRKTQMQANSVCIEVLSTREELIRRYSSIVTHEDGNAKSAVANLTEFQLGGVIDFPVNRNFEIGLVINYRPIVPPSRINEYREIWRKHQKDGEKDRDAREQNDRMFLEEVLPLLGMWSVELPRGYGSKLKSGEESARDEAEEETQAMYLNHEKMGRVASDTANVPHLNDMFVIYMDPDRKGKVANDPLETLAGRAQWVSVDEFFALIRQDAIVDPWTMAGLTKVQAYHPDLYSQLKREEGWNQVAERPIFQTA